MNIFPVEPSADQRHAAHWVREIYVALVAEGFTDQQALAIIGQLMAASQGSAS